MADLTARIKPKKSSTAGEVPQASDLEVAELAVNTADGKLFVKHTDNSIKEISGGGGAASIDDLTDVDTTTNPPSLNQILIWDGSNWVPQDIVSEGSLTEQTGNLTAFPLHGIDGFYADQAALEADGFTYIANSANADDVALTFNPGAQWTGIQFLQYTPDSANWFVNSNGGVGFDQGGGTTTGRSGNAATDAAGIDLYVSLWSQDTETRLAGYKTIQEGGFDWLVVRMDLKVPYDSETNGFPAEVWFSSGGAISVRYGTSVNGATFTVGATRNIITSGGSVVPGTSAPYTGLTGSGAYGISFYISPGTGLQLDSLGDVNAPGPTDGQVLAWDNATQFWVPQTPTGGGATSIDDLTDVDTTTAAPTTGQLLKWDGTNWVPGDAPADAVDSVNGETGVVSLGVVDMNDYSPNFTPPVGTYYTFATPISNQSTQWTCPDNGIYSTHLVDNTKRRAARRSSSGTDINSIFPTSGGTIWWTQDLSQPWTQMTYTSVGVSSTCTANSERTYNNVTNGWPLDGSTDKPLYMSTTDLGTALPIALADGDYLRYDGLDFRPKQLATVAETGAYSDLSGKPTLGTAAAAATTDFATAAQGALADSAVQPTDSIDALADVDTSTAAPTDGQVLTWDNANSVWEPATPVTSIDNLTDVDTSTTPPLDGQVLAWNSTNSEWEPASNADVSGASFIGKSSDRDGSFNTASLVVTFPSSARAGDLAIAMIGLRGNGDPAPLKDVVTPSGWTLGLSADYSSSSSTTASCSYFAFHKELSASDISTGSVTFTSDSPDAGDDWYYGLQVLRNAEVVNITNVDTTPSGSLAATGYDYTGSPVPSTGLCAFFAFNIFAFGTTSGVNITPVTNNRLVMADGPQYEVNVVRRSSQWVSLGEDDGFNIRVTNASNVDSTLNDGFHIVRFRIVGKTSSIDDLTDVDTSTVAPTDGQVLTWDNANSVWEPANPAVDSNTTQAGTGSVAINNLVKISQVDYDALGTPDANTVYFIV